MTVSPHLIGIGAGLVAAALFASLANNSTLAVTLFYLTPLPILLAGIGWGVRAAQLAFATAALLVAIILNLTTAVAFALYIGLPGVLLSHLMLLRRELPPARQAAPPLPARGRPSSGIRSDGSSPGPRSWPAGWWRWA